MYGGAELGLSAIGRYGGDIGEVATAVSRTAGVVSKLGQGAGIAGYVIWDISISYKAINGQHVSTAQKVNFVIGTVFFAAGFIAVGTAAAPFVAAAALLIYGTFELVSYLSTNQTMEEQIWGSIDAFI